MTKRITNEQREAIVRRAVAEGEALLAAPDCAGGMPCTNCPDKRQCGKTGCIRQPEFVGSAAMTAPLTEGDLWKIIHADFPHANERWEKAFTFGEVKTIVERAARAALSAQPEQAQPVAAATVVSPASVRPLDAEQIAEIVREHLGDVYHCTRVWSAWDVGTMGEEDFEPARESALADEIAAAIRAALQSPPHAQPPEFSRDDDGELLIDWSPSKGRMVSLSLRNDGRLSYAITWDGAQQHGTAAQPVEAVQPTARALAHVRQALADNAPKEAVQPQNRDDAARNALIEDCPELNMANYSPADVDNLNDWAIRASSIIDVLMQDATPQAAQEPLAGLATRLMSVACQAGIAETPLRDEWLSLVERTRAAIAAQEPRQPPAMTERDVIAFLERRANNTDTDPRWLAARELRRLHEDLQWPEAPTGTTSEGKS